MKLDAILIVVAAVMLAAAVAALFIGWLPL
jgi:hypothetical protein